MSDPAVCKTREAHRSVLKQVVEADAELVINDVIDPLQRKILVGEAERFFVFDYGEPRGVLGGRDDVGTRRMVVTLDDAFVEVEFHSIDLHDVVDQQGLRAPRMGVGWAIDGLGGFSRSYRSD